jgi:hypothetical protein
MTAAWPVFLGTWVNGDRPLGDGNVQVYGAGLNVALSERLSFGLNQGGYATAKFRENRDGWLNLGGFAQYTLIQDVPNQFLLTAGLRWEAPSGEAEVFQAAARRILPPMLRLARSSVNSTFWHCSAMSSRPLRAAPPPTPTTDRCIWIGACAAGSTR